MIKYLNCKNFRVFSERDDYDKVPLLNLEAGKSPIIHHDMIGNNVLPITIIYAEPGSGKTSVFDIYGCIYGLVAGTKDCIDVYQPFDDDKSIELSIDFSMDKGKTIYRYMIEYDKDHVISESLATDDKIVFSIDKNDFYSDDNIEMKFSDRSNPFIRYYKDKSDLFESIIKWFDINYYYDVLSLVKMKYDDKTIYDECINYMRSFGYYKSNNFIINTLYLIFTVLHNGGTAIIDNVICIHPVIMLDIISKFTDKSINVNESQLIFTSCDYSLLNYVNNRIRPDEIYIIDKNIDGTSDVYSLCEFKKINNMKNPAFGYLIGRFDGIPIKNSN